MKFDINDGCVKTFSLSSVDGEIPEITVDGKKLDITKDDDYKKVIAAIDDAKDMRDEDDMIFPFIGNFIQTRYNEALDRMKEQIQDYKKKFVTSKLAPVEEKCKCNHDVCAQPSTTVTGDELLSLKKVVDEYVDRVIIPNGGRTLDAEVLDDVRQGLLDYTCWIFNK